MGPLRFLGVLGRKLIKDMQATTEVTLCTLGFLLLGIWSLNCQGGIGEGEWGCCEIIVKTIDASNVMAECLLRFFFVSKFLLLSSSTNTRISLFPLS